MAQRKKTLHKSFKHPGGFIGLPQMVFWSDPYRDLTLVARCLLDEFQAIYRKGRNGRIVLSVATASQRLNTSYKPVSRAFAELAEHGFIECTKGSNWKDGKTREWRLTYEPCEGREPTHDWKLWEKQK
ncbi:MAG: hypothetical protein CMH28_07145 [Micavibrio sp.]|nr:hypothetical protein [Micavibrio sp.]